MPKVNEIFTAAKTLKRMENYGRRFMDDTSIEQASAMVREVRDNMRTMATRFMDMDVSELTPDTSKIRRSIKRSQESLDYWESEVERLTAEKDRADSGEKDLWGDPYTFDTWEENQLETAYEEIEEKTDQINNLEMELDELLAG